MIEATRFLGFCLSKHGSADHDIDLRSPDLHAPIVNVEIYEPDLVDDSYIFFGLYRNVDPGVYIYDKLGQLVWSGAGEVGPATAHAPRVCQYQGVDHLCFFTGEQHQGFARGHGVIMDNQYRVVKQIDSSGAGASSDMHEFKITPHSNGTTVLMTVYQPRQYDITVNPWWNLQNGMGWIVEGVFQEIDIESGKVVFEWRSLDHVDPKEAWTLPMTTDTSGTGLHEAEPWDYFHLNSIDKNEEGDYLISARHVSAIYKISGKDGSIVWQLGGNSGQFEQTNFNFSYQHHARWMSENVFSFFDNASNNYNGTADSSHGLVISIDHVKNTATMIKEFGAPEPEGGLLSTSQGNMQMLPNGGCHIGWGEHAYYSEHAADGKAVMYAKVAERASNVMIYRSNKYNWTAQPLTKPALFTFSKNGVDRMAFFVSWNGATEVRSWRFYTGKSANGPWELAGYIKKSGFETEYHIKSFAQWTYAEAVDKDRRPLENSAIIRTFVPSEKLRQFCDDRGCKYADPVPPEEIVPYENAGDVFVDDEFFSTNRGYNTANYYHELPVRNKADPAGSKADHGENVQEDGGSREKFAWATFFSGAVVGPLILIGLLLLHSAVRKEVTEIVISKLSRPSLDLGSYTAVGQKDLEGVEPGPSRSSRSW